MSSKKNQLVPTRARSCIRSAEERQSALGIIGGSVARTSALSTSQRSPSAGPPRMETRSWQQTSAVSQRSPGPMYQPGGDEFNRDGVAGMLAVLSAPIPTPMSQPPLQVRNIPAGGNETYHVPRRSRTPVFGPRETPSHTLSQQLGVSPADNRPQRPTETRIQPRRNASRQFGEDPSQRPADQEGPNAPTLERSRRTRSGALEAANVGQQRRDQPTSIEKRSDAIIKQQRGSSGLTASSKATTNTRQDATKTGALTKKVQKLSLVEKEVKEAAAETARSTSKSKDESQDAEKESRRIRPVRQAVIRAKEKQSAPQNTVSASTNINQVDTTKPKRVVVRNLTAAEKERRKNERFDYDPDRSFKFINLLSNCAITASTHFLYQIEDLVTTLCRTNRDEPLTQFFLGWEHDPATLRRLIKMKHAALLSQDTRQEMSAPMVLKDMLLRLDKAATKSLTFNRKATYSCHCKTLEHRETSPCFMQMRIGKAPATFEESIHCSSQPWPDQPCRKCRKKHKIRESEMVKLPKEMKYIIIYAWEDHRRKHSMGLLGQKEFTFFGEKWTLKAQIIHHEKLNKNNVVIAGHYSTFVYKDDGSIIDLDDNSVKDWSQEELPFLDQAHVYLFKRQVCTDSEWHDRAKMEDDPPEEQDDDAAAAAAAVAAEASKKVGKKSRGQKKEPTEKKAANQVARSEAKVRPKEIQPEVDPSRRRSQRLQKSVPSLETQDDLPMEIETPFNQEHQERSSTPSTALERLHITDGVMERNADDAEDMEDDDIEVLGDYSVSGLPYLKKYEPAWSDDEVSSDGDTGRNEEKWEEVVHLGSDDEEERLVMELTSIDASKQPVSVGKKSSDQILEELRGLSDQIVKDLRRYTPGWNPPAVRSYHPEGMHKHFPSADELRARLHDIVYHRSSDLSQSPTTDRPCEEFRQRFWRPASVAETAQERAQQEMRRFNDTRGSKQRLRDDSEQHPSEPIPKRASLQRYQGTVLFPPPANDGDNGVLLENLGTDCFMNSLMQHFGQMPSVKAICSNIPDGSSKGVLRHLGQVLNGTVNNAAALRKCLKKKEEREKQSDINEVFDHFVEKLEKEDAAVSQGFELFLESRAPCGEESVSVHAMGHLHVQGDHCLSTLIRNGTTSQCSCGGGHVKTERYTPQGAFMFLGKPPDLTFPNLDPNNIDIDGRQFQLQSASRFMGVPGRGHYVTYLRAGDRWNLINDNVRRVNVELPLSLQGLTFLLLREKPRH